VLEILLLSLEVDVMRHQACVPVSTVWLA